MTAEAGNGSDSATERCERCGQPVPVGAWPFCASPANPDGHAKGAYRWSVGTPMRKWEHVGSRGPR